DAFARSEGHGTAGAARQLPAAPGLHLDVVDDRADRDVPQRHGVARLDRGVGAGAHFVAALHALGREDVTPLAVGVLDERDVAGAVRIVLHALPPPGDAVLVALEVDDAVLLPRAAANVARGDAAEMVTRTGLVLVLGERLARSALVQVRAVDLDHRALPRGSRFVFDESHCDWSCQALARAS